VAQQLCHGMGTGEGYFRLGSPAREKDLSEIKTSNGQNRIAVLPVSYGVIFCRCSDLCDREVFVEGKVTECTKKDP
jgi:hypothetical protein